VGADAGLAPKSPPAGALLAACAPPPKRPPGVAEAVVLGWTEAEVVADFAAFPKRPDDPVDACAPVLPNSPPAGFAASVGGAPAGVVDGREKVGLAGVAAPVVAFPNRPDAGAAEVVAVEVWLALFWPNKPVVLLAGAEEAPPPKRLAAGLLALLPAFPKSPPEAGAVELAVPPPNMPPLEGAVVAAGVVEAPPPKRPPVAGVVEPPPPKIPLEEGVVVVAFAFAPPPKRPPAGFCAVALLC
jgi:hypothetical protein